ncbi:MAG: hypothetical protein GY894_03445 [Planctomycetes bacterium]|nr:hypothetical protein [Planctomycetota bacterium]
MRFRMRRPTAPPIAADLGESAIHAIQLTGDGHTIAAAMSQPTEPAESFDLESHLAATASAAETFAASDTWIGRRVVIALPASLVSMTHLRLEAGEDAALAAQSRLPELGSNPMVRTIDVSSPWKTGRGNRELLCLAMSRESVLRYVGILHDCKFDIAGVYTPASMLLRAFAHVNRRDADSDTATMYIDLGRHQTTVAFGQGASLVAARSISVAATTKHAPAAPAPVLEPAVTSATDDGAIDFLTTLNRRADNESASLPHLSGDGSAAEVPSELCEELSTCMRHYQSLFAETPVQRIVFTGLGAMQASPCCAIAKSLHLPAQIGDPLARWNASATKTEIDDWAMQLRPQWSIVAGLATDLGEEFKS